MKKTEIQRAIDNLDAQIANLQIARTTLLAVQGQKKPTRKPKVVGVHDVAEITR